MSRLRELCENNTNLKKEDIDLLEVMEMTIGQMARLEEADIYIDCLTHDQKALVVAEAKSEQSMKAGQPFWLGKRMRAPNEPAAYQALKEGVRTRGLNSVTENGCQYIQTAEPIVREGMVIGVLLKEQLVDIASDIRERSGNSALGAGVENIGISEYIDEGVIVVNSRGKVESINKSARKIYERLGYDPRHIEGMDFDSVSLRELLEVMKENTSEALSIWSKEINVQFTGEDLQLDSETAGYLSMIVNELVQNAVKHAFQGREKGNVEIKIERTSRGIVLLVADDGIGFDVKKSRDGASLGLQIVRLLTEEKLESRFELESDETGTRAVIHIPDRVLVK